MMRSYFMIIATVSLLALNVTSHAQELQATVTVNMDLLEMDDRVDVRTMKADVERYLNNQRYSGQDWEGERIPVDVTIYLTARSGNRYTARLAMVSRRLTNGDPNSGGPLLRVFDQEWMFEWTFNPTLTFQTMRFDPFVSVLDFYVLIAIGMDIDTYEDTGGDGVYYAAKQIAGLGNAAGITSFSTNYQPGEVTRMSIISELTDPRYVPLRRTMYDYHYATDEHALEPAKGEAMMLQVVEDLAYFKQNNVSNRSALMQIFFDAKAGEIADMFRGQAKSPVWDNLRFLDPGNTQMYEAASEGK